MKAKYYDIIVIGAGSAGLSIGLFMGKVGFKVLMIDTNDKSIGGECLNDGCIPSKALVHVSKIAHNAKLASAFGLEVNGKVDIAKAMKYIYDKQEVIRKHENAQWLREQGIDVELGEAKFSDKNEVTINDKKFIAKNIVIATGSQPRKLKIEGVELVDYYDNENIFHIKKLPKRMLVVGGGPIGVEIAQAFQRLGTQVTILDEGKYILSHDDESLTSILLDQLREEGVTIHFNTSIEKFISAHEAIITQKNGETFNLPFDTVFVGIGRELVLKPLQLNKADIKVEKNKIIVDEYLRTTNKNVYVCGDIAGDLQFSHAAEFHARIILNNFLSPIKKKLSNEHMSWVTFTDPELATFGLNEKKLKSDNIDYIKLEQSFEDDDRAVVDDYRYGKIVLYISKKSWFRKQKILGGTMLAPHAGELIQELILANTTGISINTIFSKIYPYPVASRINQKTIVQYKQKSLTDFVKRALLLAYKLFN